MGISNNCLLSELLKLFKKTKQELLKNNHLKSVGNFFLMPCISIKILINRGSHG
jgi:hypothetical protein